MMGDGDSMIYHPSPSPITMIEVVNRQRKMRLIADAGRVCGEGFEVVPADSRGDGGFVSDRAMRELNALRGKRETTDVLSFPAEQTILKSWRA